MCIAWRRRIRRSLTTGGRPAQHLAPSTRRENLWPEPYLSKECATSASLLTSMPVRPLRPNASFITRAARISWARCMKAPPSWTGWSRNRSAASPSRPQLPPASGAIFRSTSSIRRATWILPLKSSAVCASWMAPWPYSMPWPACSRNRKPCGGRPISTMSRASASSTRWTAWARISSTPSKPSSAA